MGLRDNQLLDVPREIGELTRLRELHIQNNRLTVLPPEVGEQSQNSVANGIIFKSINMKFNVFL